jgi:hypothetical protein
MTENSTYNPLIGGYRYNEEINEALRWLRSARKGLRILSAVLTEQGDNPAVNQINQVLSDLAEVQDHVHNLDMIGVKKKEERTQEHANEK